MLREQLCNSPWSHIYHSVHFKSQRIKDVMRKKTIAQHEKGYC